MTVRGRCCRVVLDGAVTTLKAGLLDLGAALKLWLHETKIHVNKTTTTNAPSLTEKVVTVFPELSDSRPGKQCSAAPVGTTTKNTQVNNMEADV